MDENLKINFTLPANIGKELISNPNINIRSIKFGNFGTYLLPPNSIKLKVIESSGKCCGCCNSNIFPSPAQTTASDSANYGLQNVEGNLLNWLQSQCVSGFSPLQTANSGSPATLSSCPDHEVESHSAVGTSKKNLPDEYETKENLIETCDFDNKDNENQGSLDYPVDSWNCSDFPTFPSPTPSPSLVTPVATKSTIEKTDHEEIEVMKPPQYRIFNQPAVEAETPQKPIPVPIILYSKLDAWGWGLGERRKSRKKKIPTLRLADENKVDLDGNDGIDESLNQSIENSTNTTQNDEEAPGPKTEKPWEMRRRKRKAPAPAPTPQNGLGFNPNRIKKIQKKVLKNWTAAPSDVLEIGKADGESNNYFVEEILDCKFRDGKRLFLTKWLGWIESDTSINCCFLPLSCQYYS